MLMQSRNSEQPNKDIQEEDCDRLEILIKQFAHFLDTESRISKKSDKDIEYMLDSIDESEKI